MNRRELIRAVAAYTADDVKHVESVISGATDVITAVVAKGEAVTIQGFAKFAKVERAARMGRNPRTGEAIRIKASKRVRVTPMKAFKDTVMAPSHAPRLASGVYPTSPDLLAKQAAERRAEASAAKVAPARSAGAKRTATTRTTAKKAAARSTRATATRATATRATARTAAKKAGTRSTRATATRASATRATTKRTVSAKRAPAKRATAKRSARR
ncbi:MAG: HU family DNA-binding protein [Actinomycetota bacterium]|jgi:DNA-binding protein HU-beta|nr:HU family DNA-binding protein [Actinomycetota bacterium]